jgi:hypothetical protein
MSYDLGWCSTHFSGEKLKATAHESANELYTKWKGIRKGSGEIREKGSKKGRNNEIIRNVYECKQFTVALARKITLRPCTIIILCGFRNQELTARKEINIFTHFRATSFLHQVFVAYALMK